MKNFLLRFGKAGIFASVAIVAAVSLIAASSDGLCPLKAAEAADKNGECAECPAAAAAKAAKAEKAEGECPLAAAKNAALAKGEGECSEAKNAALAKAEGECCAGEAKNAALAKAEGECCAGEAKNAALAKAEGECSAAKNASLAKSDCSAGACEKKDIVNTVLEDGGFTTLLLAAKAANMMDAFTCPQPKTLLAPTNEAFQKIPAEKFAALLQDEAKLRDVLSRHILPGAIPAEDLKTMTAAKTSAGCEVGLKTCPVTGTVNIGNAKATRTNIAATNGYIHVIDSVLLPEGFDVASAEAPAAEAAPVQVASAE